MLSGDKLKWKQIGLLPHLDKIGRMKGYYEVYNQRNTGSTESVPKENRVPGLFA